MDRKNNMYPWVDKTRNFVGGACPHRCTYCYVDALKKRFSNVRKRYTGEPRLLEKELEKSEGSGHTVFVQDCGDLFADAIPSESILRVLKHCGDYPENTYLLQTKNPGRFDEFVEDFPKKVILGTTIETNGEGLYWNISLAPLPFTRMDSLATWRLERFHKMVSIEPIMEFNLGTMVQWMRWINPKFISIGGNSKGHDLPEPPAEKVVALVERLREFTDVKMKDNLRRIVGEAGLYPTR